MRCMGTEWCLGTVGSSRPGEGWEDSGGGCCLGGGEEGVRRKIPVISGYCVGLPVYCQGLVPLCFPRISYLVMGVPIGFQGPLASRASDTHILLFSSQAASPPDEFDC